MVLDNADDLDMFFKKSIPTAADSECTLPLAYYLPQSSRGSVLITTRDERVGRRLARGQARIVVELMSPLEAQELLAKGRTEFDSSDEDVSSTLIEALEYLPLAITQAAAFISENHITDKEYLEMFRTSDADVQDLLEEDLGDLRRDSESQNSVIRTWKLSFDLISKQKPRAAEMLSLMAVLDRQGIQKSLLRNETDRDIDLTTALGTLLAFSLIKAGVDGTGYEMHRLVQLATRKWLDIQGNIKVWQEKALSVLADKFPWADFENWTICQSLLPHAQTVIQYGDADRLCPEEYANLSSCLASFDIAQGRYEMACIRFLAAFEVQKETFGSDHNFTLMTMNKLATTYRNQGRWKESEKLHVQVLEAKQKVLGAEHPDTLASMNNLTLTYIKQGRWDEAEKLQMQVLEASKRVLGSKHPNTLMSMNNLAETYGEQGRWDEAEKLHMQVLEARKRVLGAEHPDTLVFMNNLAHTYRKQDRWEEAVKLQMQVLEASKRVLGPEHPDTLGSMNNLALTYGEQGRWEEAEKLQMQVLEASKRVLGAEHPETLVSMNNLAYTYGEQGRWEEAEKLQMQVLEASKRVLRPDHPDTLMTMNNLACTYQYQDRYSEAITLMENVVELSTKVLGANHRHTIESVDCLKEWVKAKRRDDGDGGGR